MRVVEPPSLDIDVEKGKAKADDAELLKPPAVMSTKIERMLAILEETRTTKPGEKTIIFSSFTQMVRILGGRWRRIGSMGGSMDSRWLCLSHACRVFHRLIVNYS